MVDASTNRRARRSPTSRRAASYRGDQSTTPIPSDAPGSGYHWGPEAHHSELPRGERVEVGATAPLQEILFGPGRVADGTTNLVGALRRAMATTGYSDVKEFQRVEVVVSPYMHG